MFPKKPLTKKQVSLPKSCSHQKNGFHKKTFSPKNMFSQNKPFHKKTCCIAFNHFQQFFKVLYPLSPLSINCLTVFNRFALGFSGFFIMFLDLSWFFLCLKVFFFNEFLGLCISTLCLIFAVNIIFKSHSLF